MCPSVPVCLVDLSVLSLLALRALESEGFPFAENPSPPPETLLSWCNATTSHLANGLKLWIRESSDEQPDRSSSWSRARRPEPVQDHQPTVTFVPSPSAPRPVVLGL